MSAKEFRKLLRESHERQFSGEDYQAVLWDFLQRGITDEDALNNLSASPDPDCDCGFCATADWQP